MSTLLNALPKELSNLQTIRASLNSALRGAQDPLELALEFGPELDRAIEAIDNVEDHTAVKALLEVKEFYELASEIDTPLVAGAQAALARIDNALSTVQIERPRA